MLISNEHGHVYMNRKDLLLKVHSIFSTVTITASNSLLGLNLRLCSTRGNRSSAGNLAGSLVDYLVKIAVTLLHFVYTHWVGQSIENKIIFLPTCGAPLLLPINLILHGIQNADCAEANIIPH